ncbi:hypothetical protein M3Y95_00949600 [Aphelenchoides besseyi]|nr:hypothetical protein M3Y95_00949600 [Aphelenchoides besseyi]
MRSVTGQLCSSTRGLPKTSGTSILISSCGQPRSPFYAINHLQGLIRNTGVSSSLSRQLASLQYRFSTKIQKSLLTTGDYLPLAEAYCRFGNELSRKLDYVLPEYAPFNTRPAFLFDQPSIDQTVQEIIDNGTDRLIAISMYPFSIPSLLKPMKQLTKKNLEKEMSEICDLKTNRLSYVARNRPVSFDFDYLTNIGTHDCFVQYWAERLANNLEDADAVIFAVPAPSLLHLTAYSKMVNSSAKRVIYRLYKSYPRAVPYRVAFYSSWHQMLPLSSIFNSVKQQAQALEKFERRSPLIVPFGQFFKDFDSEFVLSEIVKQIPNSRLLKPDDVDTNLSHSFVELIKTNLLTTEAQTNEVVADPIF